MKGLGHPSYGERSVAALERSAHELGGQPRAGQRRAQLGQAHGVDEGRRVRRAAARLQAHAHLRLHLFCTTNAMDGPPW